MIRILLVIGALLFSGSAWAQGCGTTNPNCIVPTAPQGTSNNQAASTAFVQIAVAAASAIVSSVSNSDGTLTVSPTTGAVVVSINLGHANTWTADQTFPHVLFTTAAGNGINDQSAVAGNKGTFWTNDGPAIVHRMNRLMVGENSTAGSGTPPSPADWLESLVSCTTQCAQISSLSTLGTSGIVTGARSSDELTVFGVASGGSAGAYLFGYNDDLTSTGAIALGAQLTGIAKSGNKGITLGAQIDIDNAATTCVPTPADFECTAGVSSSIGALITAGAFSVGTVNPTSAFVIAPGLTQAFNAGIVFADGSIAAGVGPSGTTVAMAIPVSYAIVFYSGSSAVSQISADSSGNVGITTTGGGCLKVNGTCVTVP